MPNQLFCIKNVKRLKTNSFNIMQARLGPKIPRMSNVAHVDNDLLLFKHQSNFNLLNS